MFRKMKIQAKLSLTAALIFSLTYILVLGGALFNLYNTCKSQAENLAETTSVSYAKDVSYNFNSLKATETELENSIISDMNFGTKSRDKVIEMQKDVLKSNSKIYGVTVAFEQNAFDGKDDQYSSDSRFGSGGIFIPTVTRDGSSYDVSPAYDSTTNMTWYNTPKSTKKMFITEPTTYTVNGKDISLTSIVMPILDKNGNFIGVISVDYKLETLQNIIKNVKALNGGAFLISKNGLIIANGVDKSALMSDVLKENPTSWEDVLTKTAVGKQVSEYGTFTKDGRKSLLFATPVNLEGMQTDWSLVSIIPVQNIYAAFDNSLYTIIPVAVIALLALIIIMSIVTKLIVKGVKGAEKHLEKIAQGDLSEDIDPRLLKNQDEIGNLCREMQLITENLREKALIAEKISNGDINVAITEKSDKDVLSQAMKKVVATIDGLIKESLMLSKAATEGRVEVRGDENKFSGGYRQIIAGVNSTLDAIEVPVNEVRRVIAEVLTNNFTERVNGDYNGLFKDMADDINSVCKELLNLQNIIVKMSKGDTSMLTALKKRGKLSEKDDMSPSLITMLQTIENLINEVNHLSEEATNGNVIDARGNTEGFEGGYREIVEGFNKTLDSISKPLLEIMTVLNAISVNDFTLRIENNYNGDYKKLSDATESVMERLLLVQDIAIRVSNGDISQLEELKEKGKQSENDKLVPAFTQMMESINNLAVETTQIAKSAAQGKIDIRGDASKFSGDYAEIVEGINRFLDAVEKPTNQITKLMNEMANANSGQTISGDFHGQFKILVDAANTTSVSLANMIEKVSLIITELANGNFDIETVEEYPGNLKDISKALNLILDSLNEVLLNVNETAGQVAAGSVQVSQGSELLSQGATEQAGTVQQLSASISEIAARTQANAENAEKASKLAEEVKNSANSGSSQMNEMVQSMNEISESSQNISKIIKIIDDIAFQTNILALNAAVEAARAGQYGKGFAVVAEEVRNLAAKSADAAKNTSELIEKTIRRVENGMKIANDTARSFGGILEGVGNVTELVHEIASASDAQSDGISQINTGLEQVSTVIQTNSATAEESAASSEELSSQAAVLKEQISKFTLRGSTEKN